jgi:hypothetical protein
MTAGLLAIRLGYTRPQACPSTAGSDIARRLLHQPASSRTRTARGRPRLVDAPALVDDESAHRGWILPQVARRALRLAHVRWSQFRAGRRVVSAVLLLVSPCTD